MVAKNVNVSAALAVGAQRFQAALLVEPKDAAQPTTVTERAKVNERIWPSIIVTNKDAPSHARLLKSHILFTRPDKPMLRAGKGTVQRSGTLRLYAGEIDELYKDAETMSPDWHSMSELATDVLSKENVTICIRNSVLGIMDWSHLDDSTNFFEFGMDSLLAMSLVRSLRQAFRISSIAPSTVYTNPSVILLQSEVLSLWSQEKSRVRSQESEQAEERNSLITTYKRKTDEGFTSEGLKVSRPGQEQEVIMLTGSTGTLGSYLSEALRHTPNVQRIYCLNRAKDGAEAQSSKNKLFNLSSLVNDGKVSFITADFSKGNFGLSTELHQELCSTVTLVIHNAWTVDFNLPLSSFKPQLEGLVHLLSFTLSCERPTRFFFVSSISSVMPYQPTHATVSEDIVIADSMTGPNGYADSKYVAEQIVWHAAEKFPPNCSLAFARVRQVAGAVRIRGLWSKNEWFPSLIISSASIGALPDSLGRQFDQIDWIPIDVLADILVELATNKDISASKTTPIARQRADVYHPLNGNPVSWAILRDHVRNHLSLRAEKTVEIVPLRTWISKVRRSAESMMSSTEDESLQRMLFQNPVVKLLDFYETLLSTSSNISTRFEFTKTIEQSPSMQNLKPIGDEWMRKWID